MERLNSGEQRIVFGTILSALNIGLLKCGRVQWQEEEETTKKNPYCTDVSGIIVYLRALQGHTGRNLIDPSFQDNVVTQRGFFPHIYHIGCAFNLHSIINNGLIPGGQNSSKRQTLFFLPIDPRDKEHKDPEKIDLNVPRRAQYLHNAWKKQQDGVYWVDIDLAIRKGLTFYQTRSNAIILQGTLPAFCIPKVVRLKTREVLYEKAYMSLRPPPRISLKHEWKRELGSEHAQQSEVGTIGLEEKFHWVLQLINNQKEKLFDSHKKKLLDEQSSSNQSQSQSVIGQGDLITRKACLLFKVTRPVLKRSV